MRNGNGVERRATGVHKVTMTDGNGGKTEMVQVNVEKAKMIINFLKAFVVFILTVAGAVWAGVKWGINSEVHQEVETQMEAEMEPGGKIDHHMHEISMEAIEEVQGVLQDDLDFQDQRLDRVETDIGEIKGGITAIQRTQELLLQQAMTEGGGGDG